MVYASLPVPSRPSTQPAPQARIQPINPVNLLTSVEELLPNREINPLITLPDNLPPTPEPVPRPPPPPVTPSPQARIDEALAQLKAKGFLTLHKNDPMVKYFDSLVDEGIVTRKVKGEYITYRLISYQVTQPTILDPPKKLPYSPPLTRNLSPQYGSTPRIDLKNNGKFRDVGAIIKRIWSFFSSSWSKSGIPGLLKELSEMFKSLNRSGSIQPSSPSAGSVKEDQGLSSRQILVWAIIIEGLIAVVAFALGS